MRHQDCTINHRLESFVYANDSARTTASGFASGDIGRIAYQSDTGQYWRVVSMTGGVPGVNGWALVPGALPTGGTVGLALVKNSATNYDASWKQPVFANAYVSPGTFTNGTYGHAGIGLRAIPLTSGRLLLMVSGNVSHTVAGGTLQAYIAWGTGTSPVKPQAATGTQASRTIILHCNVAGAWVQFAAQSAATGFTVGTNYWIDLVLLTSAATATVNEVGLSAVEI